MKFARKHALVLFASVGCQLVSGASLTAGTNATRHQEPRSQHLRTPGHHHHHHHGHAHAAPVQPHEQHPQEQSQIEPRVLQKQVEQMAQRADRLESSDPKEAVKVDGDLEAVEASLVPRAASDPALEHEIAAVRADLCAKHGFESRQRMDCEDFMRKACVHKHRAPRGGRGSGVSLLQRFPVDEADADFVTDRDEVEMSAEVEVPVAMCKTFFREVAASESRAMVGGEPAPAQEGEGAPAGLESEAEAEEAKAEAEAKAAAEAEGAVGSAPSAAPPMSPAPAAAMAPAPAVAEEEKAPWYEADPEKGLPENGVDGELVDHDDQDTQTEDWQKEFGPSAGHRTYREICKDHPTNEWCKLHLGYHGRSAPAGWMREPKEKTGASQNSATRRGGDALMALMLGAFALVALER